MKLSTLSNLYQTDEALWLEEMAKAINEGCRLDKWNLLDYLLESAARNHREVGHRLTVLLLHLLKYTYQPRRRSQSWRTTISLQRSELQQIFATSASLKRHGAEVLTTSYERARKVASSATRIPINKFPIVLQQTLDEIVEGEDYTLI